MNRSDFMMVAIYSIESVPSRVIRPNLFISFSNAKFMDMNLRKHKHQYGVIQEKIIFWLAGLIVASTLPCLIDFDKLTRLNIY